MGVIQLGVSAIQLAYCAISIGVHAIDVEGKVDRTGTFPSDLEGDFERFVNPNAFDIVDGENGCAAFAPADILMDGRGEIPCAEIASMPLPSLLRLIAQVRRRLFLGSLLFNNMALNPPMPVRPPGGLALVTLSTPR